MHFGNMGIFCHLSRRQNATFPGCPQEPLTEPVRPSPPIRTTCAAKDLCRVSRPLESPALPGSISTFPKNARGVPDPVGTASNVVCENRVGRPDRPPMAARLPPAAYAVKGRFQQILPGPALGANLRRQQPPPKASGNPLKTALPGVVPLKPNSSLVNRMALRFREKIRIEPA